MITRDPALLAAAAALRREVFVHGQGVPPDVEADGADAAAVHSVLVESSEVVATGRLVDEGDTARLGRIVVRADRRGRGLGATVVHDLERAAAAAGLLSLRLHAQAPVVGFYQRLGWLLDGPPDVEAGLEHRWMTRELLPGLRPVTDADADGVQALVDGCFAPYQGCVLELDGPDAWMRAPGTHRPTLRVLPDAGGALAACVGWGPAGTDAVELKSLYVAAPHRRRGYAAALVGLVERTARTRGAARVELWTDTRFTDAHRLYERLGYTRLPGERPLHDASQSVEYPYAKIL